MEQRNQPVGQPSNGIGGLNRAAFKGTKRVPFCGNEGIQAEIPLQVGVIGDSGTGKTSALCSILYGCKGSGEEVCQFSTVGLDMATVVSPLEGTGTYCLRITFWDTAGQERYRALSQSYTRACHVIIVTFDVSEELKPPESSTFLQENITMQHAAGMWMDYAEVNNTSENPKVILVAATKCEGKRFNNEFKERTKERFRQAYKKHLEAQRSDRFAKGQPLPTIDDNRFFFISSVTGEGLEELIGSAVDQFKELNKPKIEKLLRGELTKDRKLPVGSGGGISAAGVANSSSCSC
jgi:small GTP-binding protein